MKKGTIIKRTDYVATLGAYLAAFGDIATAAATMNVHSNTLRYRLKRIGEITGVDLARPVDRFMLELAWHLFTWADKVEIVAPPRLQALMVTELQSALAAHQATIAQPVPA